MLDIGWTELLVIGIVALIVVGPKDLPVMFHNLGKFTARLRTMAREFTRAMDDAAQASGAKDMARDLRTMSNPGAAGKRAFTKAAGFDPDDPFGEAGEDSAPKPGAKQGAKPGAEPAAGTGNETKAGDAAGSAQDKPHGPNTAKLAEDRAAAAKARREEAAARANERAASFKGFDTDKNADMGKGADAPGAPPTRVAAPAPGASAPAGTSAAGDARTKEAPAERDKA